MWRNVWLTVCSDWLATRRARAFAYYVRQFVKLSHVVFTLCDSLTTVCPYCLTFGRTDQTRLIRANERQTNVRLNSRLVEQTVFVKQFVQLSHSVNKVLMWRWWSVYTCHHYFVWVDNSVIEQKHDYHVSPAKCPTSTCSIHGVYRYRTTQRSHYLRAKAPGRWVKCDRRAYTRLL